MSSGVASLQEQRRLAKEEAKHLARLLKQSREQQVSSSRKAARDRPRWRQLGLRILAIMPDGTAPLQRYLTRLLSGESQESFDSEE